MMSLKRTFTATILFVALVALYIADGRRRDAADAARRESIHPFGAEMEAITGITLERMGKKLELARVDNSWKIREPIQAEADPELIHNLLDQLVAQESIGTIPASDSELETFGLAQPAYAISVKTGAATRDIVFGQESPMAGRVYARMRDDAEVFTISRDLASLAIRPVNDFRDRRILLTDAATIDGFSITFEGATLEASRTGEQWNIARPMQIAADPQAVSDFLQSIQIARIADFVDTGTQELAALGLEAPTIAAFFSVGTVRQSILIGHRRIGEDKSPVYYAKRAEAPGIFAITQELFMLLQARASDLRNKEIFTLARPNASVFELEFGGRVTRLRRTPEGVWNFDEPTPRRADQASVEQLLTRLFRITVADYLEVQPTPDISGIDSPYVRISISNADGSRTEGLETGRPHAQSDHVFARRIAADGTPSEVFLIAKEEPGNFFVLPEAFEDKSIFTFAPSDVKLFTITAKGQVISFQREADAWVATLTGGQEFYQVKSTLADRYLSAATSLLWRRQLDPTLEADQAVIAKSGLDKSGGTFTFYDEAGAELGRFDQGGFDQAFVFIRRGDGVIFATDRNSYAAFVSALGTLVQFQQ